MAQESNDDASSATAANADATRELPTTLFTTFATHENAIPAGQR